MEYADASPPAIVNDTAVIDDDLPIISGVQVSGVTHIAALVTWLTDEPSTSIVRYNTTTPPDLVGTDGFTTNHSVSLTGLMPNTTYFFEVESTDTAGNTAVDDNATNYYSFTTLAIPPILLVDDDFGDFFETWYINTLNALGEAFDYWEVSTQGDPTLADVQGYTVVIWQASWPCAFSTNAQNTMASYLDGGGRLILSGQDIGWCWAGTSFYTNYLSAIWVADSAPTDRVVGVAGDPIGDGLDFFINGGDGASNNIWPSVVDPISPAVTSAQYDSGPSTRSAILRVESGPYAIAYLAFNFEGVSTAANRELLMDRLLGWISPPAFGARFAPDLLSGVSVPGGTVTYDLTIQNLGVATANDTFNIQWSSAPFGWTTSVFHSDGVTPIADTNGDSIPDTGPIPSRSTLDIVVQVDVDPGALGGDEDILDVNATSINDPTAVGTAQISTLVPPPGVLADPNGYEIVDAGATASFALVVSNSGGFPDVMDITTTSSLGWTVSLFEADGSTPLADTDGDGVLDTGTIPGLQTYPIVVTVSVPTGVAVDSLNLATVTATSSLDQLQSDDALLRVEVLGPPSPEWPQFHHDRERSGIAPVPFEMPLTQLWTAAAGGLPIRWSGPIIDDRTVYFTEPEGNLVAVDLGTGVVKWQVTLGDFGWIAGTPAARDGSVYVAFVTSGASAVTLFSVDAATGSVNWQFDSVVGFASAAFTTPAVAVGNVYWADFSGYTIHANDAATGANVWTYTLSAEVLQGPTFWNGVVYAGDVNGNLVALDAFSGAALWTTSLASTITSAPTLVDGVLYVGDYSGSLYAMDALTGALIWTSPGLGVFIDVSSPVVADGLVFVGAFHMNFADGWMWALDEATGAQVWSYLIPGGPVGTSVGYNNGTVFLTTWDGNLWAWEAQSGLLLQTLPLTTAGSTSSVALGNGYLVVGDESGKVTAFGFVGAGEVRRLEVSPLTVDIVATDLAQFDADTFDLYDNPVVGQTFSWTSVEGLGTIVPITSSGDQIIYVAGPTAGVDTLSVSIAGLTKTVTVNISADVLYRIELSPLVASVTAGGTLAFNATPMDRFGNPISASLTWSASTGLGTVSAAGVLTAATTVATGTVTVSVGNISASAQVSIAPGPLSDIVITPAEVSVETGGGKALVAKAVDQYGNEISGVTFTWTATIGTITPLDGGRAATFTAGEETGTGTITASSGGVSASASVTITQAQLSLPTQFIQPLAIAFLATVIALAAIVAYLFVMNQRMRRRLREGAGGEGGAGGEA